MLRSFYQLVLPILGMGLIALSAAAEMEPKWVFTYDGPLGYGSDELYFMEPDGHGDFIVCGCNTPNRAWWQRSRVWQR